MITPDTIITEGRYAGWTHGDWTDLTLLRLGWKLDSDKKQPGLLDPWMRSVIYATFREAKKTGPTYLLTGDRRRQVRDILRTQRMEAVVE